MILDFEKPIIKMEEKIKELKELSKDTNISYQKEIEILENQTKEYKKELYSTLSPYYRLQIARHPDRPNFLEYVSLIADDFIELRGDRCGTDDRAIIGGLALIKDRKVLLVGTQKGKSTKENLEYNFGMPQPQGYRKALRLFYHADKFNLPIITFVDTPGAYPGIKAEETGQGIAIAKNLCEMAKINVPVISIITGEGCSGGALGICVSNKVLIMEHAYYSVISPEGCASILWRDSKEAQKASEALKITSGDLLKLKIVDEIIKEPLGGAHKDPILASGEIKKSILKNLKIYDSKTSDEIKQERFEKFRNLGVFQV